MDRLMEIRDEINQIDQKILWELERRVALTNQVAEIKAETFAPVFVPEREAEIIAGLESGAVDTLRGIVAPVFKTVMRLSRRHQYKVIYDKLQASSFGEQLEGAVSKVSAVDKGKMPCVEVSFRQHEEVNSFFNILSDYGFYPLEFSLKDKSGVICRCVFDAMEKDQDREQMLIQTMYQLCNEFENVRLVGWI
ncbi:MAG: chorismate mutase [Clostridia bacterium]